MTAPAARPLVLVLGLLVLALPALAGPADAAAMADGEAAAETVAAAIGRARDDGEPFRLLAHCTDQQAFRSLELFASGIAIWNGRAQLTLSGEERQALLETLLENDFPALLPIYGGKRLPEPGAASGEAPPEGAALRIRCRLIFESGGVKKISVQQAQGEQSAALIGLAAALLDRVEPLAAERGTGAADLADGLAKLAAGELAPETFGLRLVRLPEGTASGGEAGTIVLVERGTLTRRPYSPSRTLGTPEEGPLDPGLLAELVKHVRRAQLAELPANLWAPDHLELGVRVLDHQETLIARPFRGLTPDEKGEAQKRFDALAAWLRTALLGGGEGAPAG